MISNLSQGRWIFGKKNTFFCWLCTSKSAGAPAYPLGRSLQPWASPSTVSLPIHSELARPGWACSPTVSMLTIIIIILCIIPVHTWYVYRRIYGEKVIMCMCVKASKFFVHNIIWLCTCVCVYMCMSVCAYDIVHACICWHVYVYVCMCIRLCTYVCMFVSVYVCIYVCMTVRMSKHVSICIYVYIYTFT